MMNHRLCLCLSIILWIVFGSASKIPNQQAQSDVQKARDQPPKADLQSQIHNECSKEYLDELRQRLNSCSDSRRPNEQNDDRKLINFSSQLLTGLPLYCSCASAFEISRQKSPTPLCSAVLWKSRAGDFWRELSNMRTTAIKRYDCK